MSETADKPRHFLCRNCGADIEFQPDKGMECPSCGNVERLPETEDETIEEFDFESFVHKHARKGLDVKEVKEVRCHQCGAASTITEVTNSTKCAFCGSPIVIEQAENSDVIRPEAVIPFEVTRDEAFTSFKAWLKSRWFAPNALKKLAEPDRMSGVYRPYWTYDCLTRSWYTGQRGEHYWDTEWYTDANGNRQTRQVRKTRWWPASGRVDVPFDDVLVFAGREIEWEASYKLSGLKPYNAAMLAGWQSERYSVTLKDGFGTAKKIMYPGICSNIRRDIGGDEQRIHSVDTRYSAIKFKHVLLPLWLSSYFYKNVVYRFQVNGQTGVVKGKRPYSFWKIFFFVLMWLGIIGAGIAITIATRN